MHGGFVTYVGHDGEGTAYMTMGGGCHGCSMSRMTMLDGVQTMLAESIPQITAVKDLTDHTDRREPVLHLSFEVGCRHRAAVRSASAMQAGTPMPR